MIRIGSFHIENKFSIKGKGDVFAGRMIEGIIEKGDQLGYEVEGNKQLFRIKSIEMIRSTEPGKINLGLFIGHQRGGIKLENIVPIKAVLYTDNISLSKTTQWITSRSLEEAFRYLEILIAEIDVMNREIENGTGNNSSSQEKRAGLKWSEELVHQLWKIHSELKKEKETGIQQLIENLNFYSSKSKEINSWLTSCFISSLGRFYHSVEKRNKNIL